MASEFKRSELAAKMEKDIEDFVSQLKPKKYEDGWPEDKWEEEMEKHPMFMTKPVADGEELPPLVEAMQRLKYDPDANSPEELAAAYKDDGNQYFKLKKYRFAAESYTQGLKLNCSDTELNAALLSNRAAAYFHNGGFQKALKDATEAKNLKPGYLKAIRLGARCCKNLQMLDDCIIWCEEGLKECPDDVLLKELQEAGTKAKKIAERDRRKAIAAAAKKEKENAALLSAIQDRGIRLDKSNKLDLSSLEPQHPSLMGAKVYIDETGSLVWPVMLLYPEYGISDYIQQFNENSCLQDHFKEMFNEDNRPTWDVDHKYTIGNLQAYFGYGDNGYALINEEISLKNIICDKRFIVRGGTPCFFITSKGSKLDLAWRKKVLQP